MTATATAAPPAHRLWSNLSEVMGLLGVPQNPSKILLDDTMFQHVQFKAGQVLHLAGQTFESLYIVNSGFLKTVLPGDFGNEQILSFPMKGDVLGIDGVHTLRHASQAVALSDCDLIVLPFKKLTTLGRTYPELENAIYRVMSRELGRGQTMVGMLGGLSAEARVARFLLAMSERFAAMGYSSKLFNLRMTRHDIGNYLGLTLETVSRSLGALSEVGYITVDLRTIGIKDAEALRALRRLPPRAKANRRTS